jgi:hypothetical protein
VYCIDNGRLERIMEKHSLTDVSAQLERAYLDLQKLIDHVGQTAQFWGSIRVEMIALRTSLPRAVLSGSNPLKTSLIRNRWLQVQQSYMTYSSRVWIV